MEPTKDYTSGISALDALTWLLSQSNTSMAVDASEGTIHLHHKRRTYSSRNKDMGAGFNEVILRAIRDRGKYESEMS